MNFKIHCEEYTLSNGLQVVLSVNRNAPLAAVNLWYHSGAAQDPVDRTGLAHLFEHMMFQGSQHVPKGKHFYYIQEAGGSLNATTGNDRTNYYEKVPAEYLELALWLESDRMGFFLPALDAEKLQNQIDVVRNERLERYDNQPYGLAFEKILKLMYREGHPYASPVIGSLEHINSIRMEDVEAFFSRHYAPDNAVLVVAGDIDASKTAGMIEKYFGGIPASGTGGKIMLPDYSSFHMQGGSDEYRDKVALDKIYLNWHTCAAQHDDDRPLSFLSDLLTGTKSGILYKKLVMEEQCAQSVSAYQHSGKYGGSFHIEASAKPGISLDHLRTRMFEILGGVTEASVTAYELQRIKNSIHSMFVYGMEHLSGFADQLNSYKFYQGKPDCFSEEAEAFNSLTLSDIIRTKDTYLTLPHYELRVLKQDE